MEAQETTDVEMVEDTIYQLKQNMFHELEDLIWYLINKRGLLSDRCLGMKNDRQVMHELLDVLHLKLGTIASVRQQVITEESRQGIRWWLYAVGLCFWVRLHSRWLSK